MANLNILHDYGRIEDVPMFDRETSYYTLQIVECDGEIFYRRQKVRDGKVSSSSYSIDKVKWTSGINTFMKKMFTLKKEIESKQTKKTTQKSPFDFM